MRVRGDGQGIENVLVHRMYRSAKRRRRGKMAFPSQAFVNVHHI
jgi:hypothetical protein